MEALKFIGKIKKVVDPIAREIDSEWKDAMKDPRNKKIMSTGFLFCPLCGLRKPGDHGSEYCPYCHTKMIQEGPLPFIPRSNLGGKRTKNERYNSNFDLLQKEEADKVKYGFNCITAIEKADSGKYSEANNDFTEAIKINPNDAEAYFARATIRVRMGDLVGARKDFIMCERCHCRHNSKEYPLI